MIVIGLDVHKQSVTAVAVDEAKTCALKRWIVEQEPSPPLPGRLP